MFNAYDFFKNLTEKNLLAQQKGFDCLRVSSLNGFEDVLINQLKLNNMVCVSDTSAGFIEMNNTPRTRQVKTVFLAMRHRDLDMESRRKCFDTMRELFNQFMSVLLQESVKLRNEFLYVDPRITFQEIDEYFYTRAACAHFSVAIDTFVDLSYKPEQWITDGAVDAKP